ncbi:hypothetical protein M407DRAFT_209268 [Tulasnella calospora MUT 4182]|uniref:Uncharacterized protein n=1 Tax=Tulasnella calospora MUT 4182 TaxID=1051891 RepID=A0A0C3KVL1_9AGAM|nr:hypothetical protein M407DRAFT_209268 [Tulasnella calospora MUT 4182]
MGLFLSVGESQRVSNDGVDKHSQMGRNINSPRLFERTRVPVPWIRSKPNENKNISMQMGYYCHFCRLSPRLAPFMSLGLASSLL